MVSRSTFIQHIHFPHKKPTHSPFYGLYLTQNLSPKLLLKIVTAVSYLSLSLSKMDATPFKQIKPTTIQTNQIGLAIRTIRLVPFLKWPA